MGLPLAVAFAKKFAVIGFDTRKARREALNTHQDDTGTVSGDELKKSKIKIVEDTSGLASANFHIVTVPTPVGRANRPDLTHIYDATRNLAQILKRGDTVVYESTVYPGLTEEICVPLLEQVSGLKYRKDFKVGYSPERINPGDAEHSFESIVKVVSGCDAEALEKIAAVYGEVVKVGVHKVSSIRVAEAAKVIENTQRDLNIALVNELALIFDRMGIDTHEVLKAAGTKWNFLKFKPGLVGGHCIGVDPYYLTHKAEELGIHPQVILAGRKINDGMAHFVAQKTVKLMIAAGHDLSKSTVTILGATFKEDVPDVRNSQILPLMSELKEYGVTVQICDPVAKPADIKNYFGVTPVSWGELKPAHAVIAAVSHSEFKKLTPADFKKITVVQSSVLMDVKAAYDFNELKKAGFTVWRL